MEAKSAEKREHICPYCCWYNGDGFCNNGRYWNYYHKDRSCRTILGCRYFVELEEDAREGK